MDLLGEIKKEGCFAIGELLISMGIGDNCKLLGEVYQVLKAGALKHAGVDQDVETHLSHALEHLNRNGIDEDGFSDKAHALARLLLALHRAVRQ